MTRCTKAAHNFPVEDETGAYCEEHGVTLLWHPEPVDIGTVMCPHCRTEMCPDGPVRWYCTSCPRTAQDGDSPGAIEQRETNRQQVLALIDAALGPRAVEREHDRQILTEMETTMGQTIQTRGCSKCGGTMYKMIETDDQGNPTSESMYVCNGCGNVE